jgi:hypothetical protein
VEIVKPPRGRTKIKPTEVTQEPPEPQKNVGVISKPEQIQETQKEDSKLETKGGQKKPEKVNLNVI